jgi:hypothetical protein
MMAVEIVLLEDFHRPKLNWLVQNLSQRDYDEVMAVQFNEDPQPLVDRIMVSKGFTWLATLDGRPVAVFGAMCLWPTHWSAFAFGTDEYKKVIISISRHVRRFCVPALINFGVRMVECYVAADYTQARNWISGMIPGVQEECVIREFGKNGESFVMIVWRPQAHLRQAALRQAAE